MNQQTTIFLGPQGSGKGTQVQLFKKFLQDTDPERRIVHVEMGYGLRKFGEGTTYTQQAVHQSLLRGELQPSFVTGYVMSQILVGSMTGNEHLIYDGFPRTEDQLSDFNSAIVFYKRAQPTVLNVVVPEEESVKRLVARGRSDDTEDAIRNRLAWSKNQVAPIVEWFRTHDPYNVIDIDGVGETEVIHHTILGKLGLGKQN